MAGRLNAKGVTPPQQGEGMDEESDLQPPSATGATSRRGHTQPEAVRRHGSARADSRATSEGSHAQADSVDSERTGVDSAQGRCFTERSIHGLLRSSDATKILTLGTVLADDDDEDGTGARPRKSRRAVRASEPGGVGETAGRSRIQDTEGKDHWRPAQVAQVMEGRFEDYYSRQDKGAGEFVSSARRTMEIGERLAIEGFCEGEWYSLVSNEGGEGAH